MKKIFKPDKPFPLERGGLLEELEIAYSTYGTLNTEKSNVVWVCHALTADSNVEDWWPHTVVPGGFLDPSRWFVVCANIIGSNYGTTGPLSVNSSTGTPYYDEFPQITVRDIVASLVLLADYLGLTDIHTLIGSSLGGFQAMEWAIYQPERIRNLILIATATHVSPWMAAFNESQRMAIKADATYGEKSGSAGRRGLAVARSIALLSYRGESGYNASQINRKDTPEYYHRATTYQQYQGEKLCRRFNAYSYMTILDIFDSHNICRGRSDNITEVLGQIQANTACIGLTTDILFTPFSMQRLSHHIPHARYFEINSEFGHDGFLVEHVKLNAIINSFIDGQ